ncbi:helix-turn-helix domain-containing protein [Isoptericola sp. NPDC057559]|uniref:helix-turn-helix domain-containing protein n=1 Tax=Isoptericola sp. NPDC057559 TaxID=3346168 RepID=UPI0036AA0F10
MTGRDSHDESVATGEQPLIYSVEEAAQVLRISRDTTYELLRSGQLRSIKVGRRRLIPAVAIHEYIRARLAVTA